MNKQIVDVDVAIVGGGPSGAFLGLLLAKLNISVVVIEPNIRQSSSI